MSGLIIRNGKIVSPEGIMDADLLFSGGKIAKIGRALPSGGAREVDASGLHVFPGAIDAHVHFRDPEDTTKEDFSTGSASALCGGVTCVIDMPNYRNPPTTTLMAYAEKRKIAAAKSRCDFQLRFGASETNFKEAAKSGAPSLKLFMTDTKSELGCSGAAMARHFESFPLDRPVCVHAEDGQRIAEREGKFEKHEEIRDKASSQQACESALREAGKFDRRVHICHLTTALEVEMCRRYPKATYEITPSHLFLSTSDLESLKALGKINPPLRDLREQAALWRCIGSDTIIASDHAPHLVQHKLSGAPGFPGVGTMFPLLLDAVSQKRLTMEQLPLICSRNPARAFSLALKGELKEGFDADIVLVNMGAKWRITAENRLSKCGWTPFEGREVSGKIESVFLRGKLAYDGQSVLSKEGEGREVA